MTRPRYKVNFDNLVYLPRAQDFLDTYDFPTDLVEAVVRNPTTRELDPYTHEVGYTVVRCKRGDITVVLGLQNLDEPAVLYIYLHTPDEDEHQQSGARAPAGAGTQAPKSQKALLSWLQSEGCTLRYNGRGHYNVYLNDVLVGSVGGTVHKTSLVNNYTWIRRRIAATRAKEELRGFVEEAKKKAADEAAGPAPDRA